ncbi:probable protein phosphatase 2C 28 isoform X1 [Carica papaya]|uniref:probable protein phosphatase 2C 28 isoform X1 n=1 Tax=Carica papaya TaxID=3649 RepID=UPI000B8D0077|nr:probable protein phosphatase 2C 28 isoform X1 [Carica papaya]
MPTDLSSTKNRLVEEIQFAGEKKRRLARGWDNGSLNKKEEETEPADEEEEEEEDDDDDEEQPLSPKVSHGYDLVKGKMGHGMEDYIVVETRRVNRHQLGLYAIFDGHSGSQVAEYLHTHLFDNILSQPAFWTNPKQAIKRAYKVTDDEILKNVAGFRGGSTTVTAILKDRKTLIVASVGDSRAILCRNGKAKQITTDHEPEKERDLIESKGGFVSQKPGNVPRVDGELAMTRAFGDGKLKDHITSKPDVRSEVIDEDTELIILASDGLWKVMSNQEAIDCIKNAKNAQEASEKLIEEALSRDSKDDISCIVCIFQLI